MAENIPPQPGTRYQDIPNIMANLLKVVKKIERGLIVVTKLQGKSH